jgi:competence protein ComEA
MKRFFMLLAALLAYAGLALAAVNVNTATKEQLEALDGIGPVKAQAIIDYRAKNGRFKSVDDLKNVPGIGDATLEKIRKDVTLTGGTVVPREARPAAEKKAEAAKPAMADAKSADKKAETKPTDKPGIEKKADAKKDEPKKDAKKDEPKKDAKKDEPKKDAKKDEPKKDAKKDAKKDDKKGDASKDEKKKEDEKKK